MEPRGTKSKHESEKLTFHDINQQAYAEEQNDLVSSKGWNMLKDIIELKSARRFVF